MTSNEVFALIAPKCLAAALIIDLALIIIYVIRHKKKGISLWNLLAVLIGYNALIASISFFFSFLAPATIVERTVTLKPEVITQTHVIEKENIIEVPSIMLPLNPEGTQAIVIDTTSTLMKSFMDGFYGENVYFFNNRQEATYIFPFVWSFCSIHVW